MQESVRLQQVYATIVTENRNPQGGDLRSEHGLAILLQLTYSDGTHGNLLFDTGASGDVLAHNLGVMGFDPTDLDWVVLSHCHGDHTGGLDWLLRWDGADFIVVAHPEITRAVYKLKPSLQFVGMREDVLDGVGSDRLIRTASPLPLCRDVWVTGGIPRVTSFEKSRSHMISLRGGEAKTDGEPDDMALVVDLGESGLVVFTGCSHAGSVNTVMAVNGIFEDRPIRGLVGGLHLYDAQESLLSETAMGLKSRIEGGVLSGHCTGERGARILDETFGEHHLSFRTGDVWAFRGEDDGWVCPVSVAPR